MTKLKTDRRIHPVLVAWAWLWVGLPFAYGVAELLTKATQLFSS